MACAHVSAKKESEEDRAFRLLVFGIQQALASHSSKCGPQTPAVKK